GAARAGGGGARARSPRRDRPGAGGALALGQRDVGARMTRAALIAYWYPPRQAAGSLRAAALARYLPAFGWEPVVVTVRPRTSLPLPDGVRRVSGRGAGDE